MVLFFYGFDFFSDELNRGSLFFTVHMKGREVKVGNVLRKLRNTVIELLLKFLLPLFCAYPDLILLAFLSGCLALAVKNKGRIFSNKG